MSEVRDSGLDFEGKVAVVTAAASGIGKATALRLARGNAHVIAVDLNPAVEETVDAIRSGGGKGESRVLDCMDRGAVETAFADFQGRCDGIDILVNAVGQPSRNDQFTEFWRSDPADWRFVLDICLTTTMLCTRQVLARMRERRSGKVVNISSVSWIVPPPTFTEYAAAKAGVVGFTRAVAVEMAPFGVNVNAVSPGPVRSAQTDRQPADFKARVLSTVPMGRYGVADEIAAGIAFLGKR